MKRGKRAGILLAITVVVMFILTGCSTVKAAATEEDIRACNLKPGKDVFALGEASVLLENPNFEVMKAAGWKINDSAPRDLLKDIEDVDLSKDNCVLYRVGHHGSGRWGGYCMGWAVHIPYYGGDTVVFTTYQRYPKEPSRITTEYNCVLNDGSEAIRKRYQAQP